MRRMFWMAFAIAFLLMFVSFSRGGGVDGGDGIDGV